MTERIYYSDSTTTEFSAVVTACYRVPEGWCVELNRTAFFPGGGGQPCDIGRLEGRRVLSVREEGGKVLHLTDGPVDGEVSGQVDHIRRLRLMQTHTGEHIVSGLVYYAYGYHNVGFHMEERGAVIDFDGELSPGQLEDIQLKANLLVAENRRVYSTTASEVADYRAKKELHGDIRVVVIDGVDACACCAPHLKRTGQVGAVKLMDAMRHRGGIRLTVLCGLDAVDELGDRLRDCDGASAALSAKRGATTQAILRLFEEHRAEKLRGEGLRRRLVEALASGLRDESWIFEKDMEPASLRELAALGAEKRGALFAAFTGSDGEYRFALCDPHGLDIPGLSRGLKAKGGGRDMMTGVSCATRREIEEFLSSL